MLRAISALSVLSIVGVLVFAVMLGLSDLTPAENDADQAIYIAILHFIMPFGVAYTVTTNNRLSRYIIAVYSLTLCSATVAGKGFLGGLPAEPSVKILLSVTGFVLVVLWLFASPKMRYYYALISNQPVPPELEARAAELAGKNWLGPRARAVVDWITGHMETVVLIGFTVAAFYSCVSI